MSLQASATFTDVQTSPGVFQYTLTLTDTGSTTVGTFWFAWDDSPDQDFMSAQPTNIASPSGWSALVTTHTYSGGTGYGIQWRATATTADLTSGNSLPFTFSSTETPAEIGSASPFDSTFPTTSSFVYIDQAFGDPGFQFTVTPACFCGGTLIRTERGEVAVEDLAIGDRVVTLTGRLREIRWIGRRAYDGRFVARNRALLPIRIAGSALADGVPARDLWLSPEHAVYLDGALVRAQHLVNGATIVQAEAVERVEYFHIELDTHDVVLANGAPAETFVDCDNRMMFTNSGDYARIYPDDQRPGWAFCAPRLEWGAPELTKTRAALLARVRDLGHAQTSDPDLHLIVDGVVMRPTARPAHRCYRFAVPARAADLRIASATIVPAEVVASSTDLRRLGVPIERVKMYDDDHAIELRHSHPALQDGFHAAEATHRWTAGLARLPVALVSLFPRAFVVEVKLAPSDLEYRVPAAADLAAA